MKKILFILILTGLLAPSIFAQKVTFSLLNARLENGKVVVDVYATIPSGQTWKAGPTNIRVNFYTEPAGFISLVEEDPVSNANSNISNNANYGNITSTSILNGGAASLNILLVYQKTAYQFSSGSYWLGSLKFNWTNQTSCIYANFNTGSAVFDDNTALAYGSGWSKIDPLPCIISSIAQIPEEVPTEYQLSQNYPNPFNPQTKIKFSLPKEGFVTLKVFDMLGREVASLVNDFKTTGTYIVDFDGSELSSGIYYYRLESPEFFDVKKMILIK